MNFNDILLEMIEDELRKLRSMGMEDIDRIDAGPYKMFLLKNQTFHYDSLYDVALTSDEEDFTTPHAQRDRAIGHQMIDIARNWKRLSNKLRQWSIEYGDEFRFEGREELVYQVGKIFGPADSGSGRLSQTGSIEVHFNYDLPVSASSSNFNLDHFVIRRYIDDPAQIIMEGFKPVNSAGPFIVRPEYVVPELDKSVDEFILDLTQKGLL